MRQLIAAVWRLIRSWWRVDRIRVPRSQWRTRDEQLVNNKTPFSRDRRERERRGTNVDQRHNG